MRRQCTVLGTAILASLGLATAQNNEQANSGIPFNFSNPGARSLALGGAFTALADDATAAYANPSGLVQLKDAEVSVEGRAWWRETSFPDRGHAFGSPTGMGVDTVAGLDDGSAEDHVVGPSFVSFVYPRESWAVAVFAHQLADVESSNVSQGPFFEHHGETERVPPARTRLDLSIRALGAAAAVRLGDVALGASVAYVSYDLSSKSTMYGTDGPFGAPDFSHVDHGHSQEGDDAGVMATFGALWRIDRRFAVGAVYRRGPTFDAQAFNLTHEGVRAQAFDTKFHLPDVYGVGLAFTPTESLRLTLDYDRVRYTALVDDIAVTEFHTETGEEGVASPDDYRVDDASEIHVGAEYLFLVERPVAVRVGAWIDPDHRIRYEGPVPIERVLFRAGDDEIHVSAGVGLVLGNVKLDAGVDVSDTTRTGSLSFVMSF